MRLSFHPRVWVNPIFPALWPIEKDMFCAAISQEDFSTSQRLRSQFESYNFARRYQCGREVFLYNIKFGLFESRRGERLDIIQREIPWFEFKIKLTSGRRLKSTIYIVNGVACCISYNIDANRLILRGASIIEYNRIIGDFDKFYINKQLEVPEDLDEMSRNFANYNDSIYLLSSADAYTVNLDKGEYIFIGEFIGKGAILFSTLLSGSVRGVYFGPYDGCELEYLSTNLSEAILKLKEMNG